MNDYLAYAVGTFLFVVSACLAAGFTFALVLLWRWCRDLERTREKVLERIEAGPRRTDPAWLRDDDCEGR